MGYIRKLCNLYGVSREDADALTAGLRERLQYELPEDITKTVVDREGSEEDERKQRQLLLLIVVGLSLSIILVRLLLIQRFHILTDQMDMCFIMDIVLYIITAGIEWD